MGAAGAVLQGAYGVLTVNPDGSYSYDANSEGETTGQTYVDTFTLAVSDGHGGATNETLTIMSTGSPLGDSGANTIIGGSGAPEVLEGGAGPDLLIAGRASDTFLYLSTSDSPYSASGVTYDAIERFRSGTDKIDVSAADGGPAELVT